MQQRNRIGGTGANKARMLDYFLCACVLAYVWRIQDLFPILAKIEFPSLVSVGALIAFYLEDCISALPRRLFSPIMSVVCFIVVWMALSVPGSVYPGLSFGFVVSDFVKTFALAAMIAVSARGFPDIERIIVTNVVGAVLYCTTILAQFSPGSGGRLGRLGYYDANDLALLVVCTLPLAIYFLRTGALWWHRLLALAASGVFAIAIVRSGSRGGFVALIAVVLVILVAFRAIRARTRITAVACGVIVLFAVAGPKFWEMMGTILHPESDYNTSHESGRLQIWKRGFGYMMSRPVFGVGANAFRVAEGTISEEAARQSVGRGFTWTAAHNSFVQIGAELGIPGLIAFCLLLVRLFRVCWRTGRRETQSPETALAQATFASLVGYVVAGSFLSQAYSTFLYTLCAVVTALAFVAHGRSRPAASVERPLYFRYRRPLPE